ncbi:MAG: hypothetical protein CMJ83_10865 [Planctomycetes bacterium]|nr:hypothetical protein [Planctomycetota bacterium]
MRALPLLTLCLLLAACQSPPMAEQGWEMHVALQTQAKLGGCVVADFDTSRDDAEIVVTSSPGDVFMVRRAGEGWASELVAHFPGEMIQVAAGDLDPTNPGAELVCVGAAEGGEDDGGPGVAWFAWRDAKGWHHERLIQQDALIHGVAIGDFDKNRPGLEVMVAGYTRRATVIAKVEGAWKVVGSVELPGEAKGVAAGLSGAAVVCADGSLVEVRQEGSGWGQRVLRRFPAALARVSADPSSALFCANDGTLRNWSAGTVTELYRSTDRLRGAVVVDVDPNTPGKEICTAGYTGEITIMNPGTEGGVPRIIAWDDNRFHHLAAGRLPGLGTCLVGCGYSGRVLVVRPR